MYIKQWYSNEYQKANIYDTVKEILEKLHNSGDSVVVIREDGTLYNCLSIDDIDLLKSHQEEEKIFEVFGPVENFLYDDDLVEDALILMLENRITVLPVVDNEMYPVGIFGFFEVLKSFRSISAMEEPGTKVMLSLEDKPGELKKILETLNEENINILSLMTSKIKKDKRVLTLKLGVKDVNYVSDIFEKNKIDFDGIYEEDGMR